MIFSDGVLFNICRRKQIVYGMDVKSSRARIILRGYSSLESFKGCKMIHEIFFWGEFNECTFIKFFFDIMFY